MRWLSIHLDWCSSVLRTNNLSTPTIAEAKASSYYFTHEEMTVIKNIWRSSKAQAQGRTIILAGRDVFVFEILARREAYPTEFIPECSRQTVSQIKIENIQDKFLLDTGFMGSIPLKLNCNKWELLSAKDKSRQVYPHLTKARNLALRIENTPKYWKSGFLDCPWRKNSLEYTYDNIIHHEHDENCKVKQELTDLTEFSDACILTIQVYTDSSPTFINKKQPLGENTSWKSIKF